MQHSRQPTVKVFQMVLHCVNGSVNQAVIWKQFGSGVWWDLYLRVQFLPTSLLHLLLHGVLNNCFPFDLAVSWNNPPDLYTARRSFCARSKPLEPLDGSTHVDRGCLLQRRYLKISTHAFTNTKWRVRWRNQAAKLLCWWAVFLMSNVSITSSHKNDRRTFPKRALPTYYSLWIDSSKGTYITGKK